MREQMLEYGFDVYPEPDGQIHRFKGPDDKRQNGWYICDGDHGAFGNWKTGIVVKWSERGKLTDQERRDLNQQIREQSIVYAWPFVSQERGRSCAFP